MSNPRKTYATALVSYVAGRNGAVRANRHDLTWREALDEMHRVNGERRTAGKPVYRQGEWKRGYHAASRARAGWPADQRAPDSWRGEESEPAEPAPRKPRKRVLVPTA